jgi:hypothetical protein
MNNPNIQAAIDQIGTLHEARFVLLDGGKRRVPMKECFPSKEC